MKILTLFLYFSATGIVFLTGTPALAEKKPKPVEVISTLSEQELFNKALTFLQEGRSEEAIPFFLEFLKLKPFSEAGRFNLALSYLQSEKKGLALAYLRQLIFQNPYHRSAKVALKKLGDKKYFWLWFPMDLTLVLIALSWGIFIFILFRKKNSLVYLYMPVFLVVHCFSGGYFYYRLANYVTLTKDSVILSAPDPKAPALVEQKAGVLLKKLSQKPYLPKWIPVKIPVSGQKGWLYSPLVQPLKVRTKEK